MLLSDSSSSIPGKGLIWSIAVIEVSFLTAFGFLGTRSNSTLWLTWHNNRLCHNGQGVLVPLAPKARECIDEVGLSWILEGSSFDPVRLLVPVTRSAEVDWTGLASLDTWLPSHWKTIEVFDFPEGHTTVYCRRPFYGDVSIACRNLSAHATCFAVHRLLSMNEAHAKIFNSDGAPGLISDAMGGDLRDD